MLCVVAVGPAVPIMMMSLALLLLLEKGYGMLPTVADGTGPKAVLMPKSPKSLGNEAGGGGITGDCSDGLVDVSGGRMTAVPVPKPATWARSESCGKRLLRGWSIMLVGENAAASISVSVPMPATSLGNESGGERLARGWSNGPVEETSAGPGTVSVLGLATSLENKDAGLVVYCVESVVEGGGDCVEPVTTESGKGRPQSG